ncbi:MAG: hypothetical protein HY427_03275 [Candidatus Levybacteria bacterium]|nr:hypothetical protein [Candidatus Levybacteria bacterium]
MSFKGFKKIKYLSLALGILIFLVAISFIFSQENDKNNGITGITGQKVRGITTANAVRPAKKQSTPTPTKIPVGRTVYFGIWQQGFFDAANNTLHPEALKSIENEIGKKVAIAHYYRGWHTLDSSAVLNELQTISSNGWRPMISANPYFFDRCKANGMSLYRAIAQGNCDDFLRSLGRNLKAFGKPIFFRFAWEMNVPSMEWEIQRTGSLNSDFIDAWRHVHDVLYGEGAINVLFVFCPNEGGNVAYSKIYPGDAFVDWVGLDGYNWGTTQSWSSWRSFRSVFETSYYSITAVAPTKPLMLGEVNTTDQGGDKPAWYKDALSSQIPSNFPQIKAIVVYNENRTTQEHVNWLISVSPASKDAFSEAISSSVYLSSF